MVNYFKELYENRILIAAIMSWAAAQFIKILIELWRTKKLNLKLIMSSGGMPSSHTSFVVTLAISIGIVTGFNTPLFATAAVLSSIVMYDASGVRRAAGKQAAVINMIVEKVEDSGIKLDEKLKELLGHSPLEVAAGAVLGILVALLVVSR